MKDALRLYLDEIGSIPLLTPEQETDLGRKARGGDQVAKDQIIKANLRLVVAIAKNYATMGMPILDLISEGNIGLVRAVEKFNPEFANKFCTYASWWIRNHIRKALIDKSRTIRLPDHIGRKVSIMLSAQVELEEKLGRAPTSYEIAAKAGVSEITVSSWMNFNSSTSLEAMAENGEEISCDQDEEGISKKIENADTIRKMTELMADMSERDQSVLVWRFGLDGNSPLTLTQIGDRLGLTCERARQIIDSAVERLTLLAKGKFT